MSTPFAQIPLPSQDLDSNEEISRRIEFLRSKKQREERSSQFRRQNLQSTYQLPSEVIVYNLKSLEGNLILDSKGFAQTSLAREKRNIKNFQHSNIQYSVGGGLTETSPALVNRPFLKSLPPQTTKSPYLEQNVLEGGSKLLDAFNPKHGVTLRAGSILKRGIPQSSSPRAVKSRITSHTLPVMREKSGAREEKQFNPIIKLTPKILKKNKALTTQKISQGVITIHSDLASALQSPPYEVHRDQLSYIPNSKVPSLGPLPINERRVSSPFESVAAPKLPVLPPSSHQGLPVQKQGGYGKMKIEDGKAARAIPLPEEVKRERKKRMMYGNCESKKLRRGQSHHI